MTFLFGLHLQRACLLMLKARGNSNFIIFGIVINKTNKIGEATTLIQSTIKPNTILILYSFFLQNPTDLENTFSFVECQRVIGIGCKIVIDPYSAFIELIDAYHLLCSSTRTEPIENPLVCYQCLLQQIHNFEERNLLQLLHQRPNRLVINLQLSLFSV